MSYTSRIVAAFALLLLGFCLLVAFLGHRVTIEHERETLQRVSHGLARHIVEHWPEVTRPAAGAIDRASLDNVLHMLMVVNPAIDVYVLDQQGEVRAYLGDANAVRQQQVDMDVVRSFLGGAPLPLLGSDPKAPNEPKIFSAAMFPAEPGSVAPPGYLYVVLNGQARVEAESSVGSQRLWRSTALVDEASTESAVFLPGGDIIVGNFSSLTRINVTDGSTVWSVSRTCPTTNGCEAAVFKDRIYVWEASTGGPRVTAFNGADGDRLYSSPGIGGGFIQQLGLMVGRDGTVYAPRTQNNPVTDFFVAFTDTGGAFDEKWRVPMGYVPFASHAVGPDGTVYTYAPTREILRLNPNDGTVISMSAPIVSDFHQPRIAIGADGIIYFTNGGFSGGRVYSFNADLTERWSEPVPNVNVGGPAIGENGVLIVCGVGTNVRAYFTEGPPPKCACDWNNDTFLNSQDFFDFITDFFANNADFNNDLTTNSQDFFDFLSCFFTGC